MPETRFLKETGFLSTSPRMKTAMALSLAHYRRQSYKYNPLHQTRLFALQCFVRFAGGMNGESPPAALRTTPPAATSFRQESATGSSIR
ncbi:hypothetical protein [Kamptonema formosum]|uniref:hypothetical protein n=1 Tax=Kamptonema formosum TaxID=331992 RepID=UPI0012DCE774|nr:hypothetical protein [Oscillatoria sp. PCC 10802]